MFFILDFDGNVGDTFSESPNGIGVHKAYEIAVFQLFGQKGLNKYREEGGLRNRAPGEVVEQLYGKPSVEMSQRLVQLKLACFLDEIGRKGSNGKRWPQVFPGALDFLKALNDADIAWAILSSGHREFIRRSFALWNLPSPAMFTDDEASRADGYPSKPNPILLELVCREAGVPFEPSDIVYIGDDPIKDGGLAQNSGARFGWFNLRGKTHISTPGDTIEFRHWNHVSPQTFFRV